MFPPKKILFPVDFSERCASVAPMAETFTRRFQSELTLLHVLPPEALDVPFTPAQAALETFVAHKLAGIETKQVLLHGDPAGEIVRFAQEQNSDLIMMPTHGYGPFRRFLFGSVTAKVLHDARPAVWTDVHAEEIVSHRETSFHCVACALDLSEKSQSAMRWAAQFCAETGARLLLVHAIPLVVYAANEFSYWNWQQELTDAAREQIDCLQRREGTHATVDIVTGAVPYAVRAAAEGAHADLLVIGRSLDDGQAGRLRTHAYPIIQHSPCPAVSV